MNKKLQVFVSSTYKDLLPERQAVVQAILLAGHIPAGMELFAAGDKSQLDTIRRWIDESDVYMLILGGRYGSIDPDSGKSYTHLEYEYAIEKGKPYFAAVMAKGALEQKVRDAGQDVLELENQAKYREFKGVVESKICRFF
jgi:nucleoside 2-deoxyribosyltransferase